jgi:hypothetical protein
MPPRRVERRTGRINRLHGDTRASEWLSTEIHKVRFAPCPFQSGLDGWNFSLGSDAAIGAQHQCGVERNVAPLNRGSWRIAK